MKNLQHKKVFLIWLAIYPLITVISLLFGDFLAKSPIPVRTLILTIILVPLMSYILLPFYNKVFDKWLSRGKS